MSDRFSTPLTHYLAQQQVAYRLLLHQTPASTIAETVVQHDIRPAQK